VLTAHQSITQTDYKHRDSYLTDTPVHMGPRRNFFFCLVEQNVNLYLVTCSECTSSSEENQTNVGTISIPSIK
jgi:hypothetical protein